jgi:hypothetical protein
MDEGTRSRVPRTDTVWARILTTAGIAMIPWIIVLSENLPGTTQARHWSATWLGLDMVMAVCLLVTGLLLRRGDERFRLVAASTATLLVVDAWFDTMTAAAGRHQSLSVTLAVVFELPTAALCLWLALRSAHRAAGPAELSQPS